LVAFLVVYTHRSNIKRLREGTEAKFSFSRKPEIQSN
jgi:glycerol-3-phosphate acyltransferase PlsY